MSLNAYPSIPIRPSTQLGYELGGESSDTLQNKFQIPKFTLLLNDFESPVSSALNLSIVVVQHLKKPLELPIYSTSHISIVERSVDRIHAEERAASVNVESASKNLFEIRRLTGFNWKNLAKLLNVDRRALNNWVKGTNIRNKNRQHIAKTLGVLRFIDRGLAELNSAALIEQNTLNEISPFEAIRTGNYEMAKLQLSYGTSRPDGRQAASPTIPRYGDLQLTAIHPDADGTELIEPLPYEPPPVSRKRTIRHR